jgi:hypothetical protein
MWNKEQAKALAESVKFREATTQLHYRSVIVKQAEEIWQRGRPTQPEPTQTGPVKVDLDIWGNGSYRIEPLITNNQKQTTQ